MNSALLLWKYGKLTFDVRIQNRNLGLHANLEYTTGIHGPTCDWCDNQIYLFRSPQKDSGDEVRGQIDTEVPSRIILYTVWKEHTGLLT
jgi:hypothetical protein